MCDPYQAVPFAASEHPSLGLLSESWLPSAESFSSALPFSEFQNRSSPEVFAAVVPPLADLLVGWDPSMDLRWGLRGERREGVGGRQKRRTLVKEDVCMCALSV